MPFEYLEDAVTSDVTFRAWGASLDELFAAAVDATTAAMVPDLASVAPRLERAAALEAPGLDLLLLRVLEEIVFHKDSEGLLLRASAVRVAAGPPCRAAVRFAGERIDRARHQLVADVKAVTLYGLRVEPGAGGWIAQVTLDV